MNSPASQIEDGFSVFENSKNIAFIDGQNLHAGTALRESTPWKVDLRRFRVYLAEKYDVTTAYYFLGFSQEKYQSLYNDITRAGFTLRFREHNTAMLGKKKGNVDVDIVFAAMKILYAQADDFEKFVLVSGDGDYKILVDFLITEDRFEKILFPNTKYASSLYKKIGAKYFAALEHKDVRRKIERK